jgi:hypothetical protein
LVSPNLFISGKKEYSWPHIRENPIQETKIMARRTFLAQLAGLPFLAMGTKPDEPKKPLKIMMKSAWGSDDPTRAAFPFAHGLVLAEAGHNVQIFLLAEATAILRKSMVNSILPVGWPPLSETLAKVVAKHIPIFA